MLNSDKLGPKFTKLRKNFYAVAMAWRSLSILKNYINLKKLCVRMDTRWSHWKTAFHSDAAYQIETVFWLAFENGK